MSRDIQPAELSYFFSKGYTDLINTIRMAWRLNLESASGQMKQYRNKTFLQEGGCMHLAAAISIYAFGSILSAVTTVLHVCALVALFGLVYLGFGTLWLVDRGYMFLNGIRNACPNPDCQEPFLIPHYRCPRCSALHTNLVPSKYGILNRTCNCGEKLPTTFLNGRGKLQASCPKCRRAIQGDTASRQYALPVVGGPSVGKSSFITMAVDQLLTEEAPRRGWEMDFITDAGRRAHQIAMDTLRQGQLLLKTELSTLTASQISLQLPGERVGRRLYLYDISGERFSSSDDIMMNPAFRYAGSLVFLVDPLSLPDFRWSVEQQGSSESYAPSTKDIGDILNILIINLERMDGAKNKDILKRDLAVVLNKADIPALEERLGDQAVAAYMAAHPEAVKTEEEARDVLCRNFLKEFGGANFVKLAESRFRSVRFFPCSALGHNADSTPFEGRNVTAPILWLLQQADPAIRDVNAAPAPDAAPQVVLTENAVPDWDIGPAGNTAPAENAAPAGEAAPEMVGSTDEAPAVPAPAPEDAAALELNLPVREPELLPIRDAEDSYKQKYLPGDEDPANFN